ncbi:hypothetical protein CbC4_6092 (plasmid) [Clostridium botulinum BKT015925]|nr:hypothetical protein CbC4_6092 [Clostridium botulinum BKT015925]
MSILQRGLYILSPIKIYNTIKRYFKFSFNILIYNISNLKQCFF